MLIGKRPLMALSILLISGGISAETIGLFSDPAIEQIKFAATDVKAALEAKGFTVEMQALSNLTSSYANKKVVMALSTNSAVTTVFTAQGGTAPTGLGEQSYALISTQQGSLSHWVLGGDITGTMYGGFQIAENIASSGMEGSYNTTEKPHLLSRAAKLNLPFDKRLPTYSGYWTSKSATLAIPAVWDFNFWKTLIDSQSRNRYNMLTIWSHHFFPALVKVPGWEKACLPDIQFYDGTVKAELTHEARVAFFRKVMQYAHSRGIKFYFFNWNVYVDYAKDQYPQLTQVKGNAATVEYMSKSMKALIETYPELDGFGISAGDGMYEEGGNWGDADKAKFTWDVYGKTVQDYALTAPDRKFDIIHRSIGADFTDFDPYFSKLNVPGGNTSYRFSVKYTYAHAYGTPTPGKQYSQLTAIAKATTGTKTFLTMRNEDFFYLNWGNPNFIRTMMKTILSPQVVAGFYIGSDNISPTWSYLYKDANLNKNLTESQRLWYTEMLWGRLSYNPDTPDEVFKKALDRRYKSSKNEQLFTAWTAASRALPKVTEMVQDAWLNDYHWWPEACMSDSGPDTKRGAGFRLIEDPVNAYNGFIGTKVANKSTFCSISETAAGTCDIKKKKSAYMVADSMQLDAQNAITLTKDMTGEGKQDLELAIKNVKQMAFLSSYYAFKIRGATYKAASKPDSAKIAMGQAYCDWMVYTRLMEDVYLPDSTRSISIPNWRWADALVLGEYKNLGGTDLPNCKDRPLNFQSVKVDSRQGIRVSSFTSRGILFNLPEGGEASVSLYNSQGKLLLQENLTLAKQGLNEIKFGQKLRTGLHFVRIVSGAYSTFERSMLTSR
jgi:hypothetical protein